jgi:hypothetical protein
MSKQPNQVDNPLTAVDNAEKVRTRINNTQLGSPIDTIEEYDAQLHNLGPLDSRTEVGALNNDEPEHNNTNSNKPGLR